MVPTIDPSENVKALNKAGIQHLRDMLALEVSGLRREIKNRAMLVSKVREIDRSNQTLIDERLQAGTEKLMETIEQTAKTLSNNVAETARSLASQHASNFDRLSSQHQANFDRLSEKVAALERVQIQGAGQAGVRDPMIDKLMSEVAALRTEQNKEAGKSAGLSLGAKVLVGTLAALSTILGLIAGVMAFT